MPKNHKQHFVPRGYVAGFAGNDGHVHALDRTRGTVKRVGHRTALHLPHYYRQEWAPRETSPDVLEHYFARKVETALPPLRKLGAGLLLNEEESVKCLTYVTWQFVRVPANLDGTVEMMRQSIVDVARTIPDVREALDSGAFTIRMRKSARFDAMRHSFSPAFRCLAQMRWERVLAPESKEFVTSDNPVVPVSPRTLPPERPGLGIGDTTVIFPLSPSVAFRLTHTDPRPVAVDVSQLGQSPLQLPAVDLTAAQVDAQNQMLATYASGVILARTARALEGLTVRN